MDTEPTYVMVLGPMQPKQANAASSASVDDIAPQARTRQLIRLLRSIWDQIKAEDPAAAFADVIIEGPDEGAANDIVHGILVKIERADLVVADLTGNSSNVAYELGLVHSLGLPYILLTSDDKPIFYFRMSLCCSQFDLAESYDSKRASHRVLHDRFREFLISKTNVSAKELFENFVRSHPTNFFKVPVVDISAASGLAAGYWRNSLVRFARTGGYFSTPRRITWENGRASDHATIEKFIAIRPPSELLDGYDDDFGMLETALTTLGFGLIHGTIHGNDGDREDIGSFRATFLAQVSQDGHLAIQRPFIVLELPTTLYALPFAPRILRINSELLERRRPDAVAQQRRRRLTDMIDRFDSALSLLIAGSQLGRAKRQFVMIKLDQLAGQLRL